MMKKAKIALFLTFILTIQLLPSAAYAANDASGTLNYDDAVPEAILAGMTAEEKVAQMIMPAFRWYPDENGEKQNVTELPADVAAILEKHNAGAVYDAKDPSSFMAAAKKVQASTPDFAPLLSELDAEKIYATYVDRICSCA